ncbi:MAG: NUDIX hydrolase [Candidatus Gracilibacteria bacterium]|nr:NUDIX hydrolase [Candidatus Gracilibacteria bacterium]
MTNNMHTFDEEMIDVYDLEGNFVRTQNRKEFNNEIKEDYQLTGEVKYTVRSVGALLLNSEEDFLLVQRGNTFDSPGLIDKTIGGHVSSGETYDDTVVRELEEEIGVEGVVANDSDEFKKLLKTIDTTKIAVLLLLDNKNILVNVEGDKPYKRSFDAGIYMGVYNGKINNFPDGSAKSSVNIPGNILLEEIEKNKEKFTNSLPTLIKDYRDLILSKIR